MKSKVNSTWTRQLLDIVDSDGTNLTRKEVDFVADLIDRDVKEFTAQESRSISRLHQRRVVNGKEDDE